MNFRHKIFGEKEQSSLNQVFICKINGVWSFRKDDKFYALIPASIIQMNLSPIVLGADKAIINICNLKKIKNPQDGLNVYFSIEEFLDCDIRLELKEKMFDGWIYNVFSEKIKVDETQKIWSCQYLNLYFENPPKKVYLKIEK